MKSKPLSTSDKKIFEDLAENYIKLHFKGQYYTSAILFVKILLKKLKENQKQSDILTIKDILDREVLL
jgi:hypothetical protein